MPSLRFRNAGEGILILGEIAKQKFYNTTFLQIFGEIIEWHKFIFVSPNKINLLFCKLHRNFVRILFYMNHFLSPNSTSPPMMILVILAVVASFFAFSLTQKEQRAPRYR